MNGAQGVGAARAASDEKRAAGGDALAQRLARGIRAIKATQRALGLDDDTYRALLAGQTGKTSATQLTLVEQGSVLDYMRRTYRLHPGAANPAAQRRRDEMAGAARRSTTPAAGKEPLLRAVQVLLEQLGELRGERLSLYYADAICRRNGWCDCVDFATPQQLHRLVGALAHSVRHKAEQRARAAAAGGNE